MKIPVYLFTGFLEAGKTRFIQETLEDKRFDTGEDTLLLICEEGLTAYDPTRFCSDKVYIETMEHESELTPGMLKRLLKKRGAKRVLVEYNGMWLLKTLFEALPDNWVVAQEFMFVQTETFLNYNQNMRSLVAEKLTTCELVVFNRFSDTVDKTELHKIVRAMNTRASIAFEYPDGHVEYDEIEDPLPFDRDAPIVTVVDKDYAYFYRDVSEHLDFYDNKAVCFTGIVAKNKSLNKQQLVIGRYVMTCCAEDVSFAGFLLQGRDFSEVENASWVKVTAKFKLEYSAVYGRKGPVLYIESLSPAKKPASEVATFY